jgi:hypothetical protein
LAELKRIREILEKGQPKVVNDKKR